MNIVCEHKRNMRHSKCKVLIDLYLYICTFMFYDYIKFFKLEYGVLRF